MMGRPTRGSEFRRLWQMFEDLNRAQRAIVEESLRNHADLMYDMGAEEELKETESLLEEIDGTY